MTRKRLIYLIAAGALSTALFSCTTGGNVSKAALTLVEAKAAVLAEEKRITSVIPPSYVEEHKQLDSAHLISCRGGEYTWPDQSAIVLKGDPDISYLLALIVASYRNRPGFSVKLGKTWDGAERVIISGKDGSNYYLSQTVEGSEIQFDSFSACFKLAPDQWAGDRF